MRRTIRVERPRDPRMNEPRSRPRSAPTPGWTTRAPSTERRSLALWSLDADPTLVSCPGKTPMAGVVGGEHPSSTEQGRRRASRVTHGPCSPCGRPDPSPLGRPPTVHDRAPPHATCSHPGSAGGGTPVREMKAVHTSGCPQIGQRSGDASPQASPSRSPSSGSGSSTGP
jgi:hypothetical protein